MNKNTLFSALLLSLATLPSMAGGNAKASSSPAKANKAAVNSKAISKNLFGIFFEDLNYAADGGLYAELVQNRSFEYSPSDLDSHKQPKGGWHSFTGWEYLKWGNTIATLSLESKDPIHANNPHYLQVNVKTVRGKGPGIRNHGYDGIVVKKGATYRFSAYLKNIVNQPSGNWQDNWALNPKNGKGMPVYVSLKNKKGESIADTTFTANSTSWKKYEFNLTPKEDADTASLALQFGDTGSIAIDMVSLFPTDTYKGHKNGLRKDLAETIAALKPAFVRFPGGCLSHGDGIDNIYNWKNTIGPVEQRKGGSNIWNYHQSMGLGYFEYLQFCEDIGAKPLPVIAAGVSCQNSARSRGKGQEAVPMELMSSYIQDILDLIEYCNGPVTSTWGKKRAEAGHPKPFNLEYIGIGNEDHITEDFKVRFKMIFDAIHAKYPHIKVVGTSGPGHSGKDYEEGWKVVRNLQVPVVDEHYYCGWGWFIKNLHRYDSYPRTGYGKVYVGEYASWGSELQNALAEAAYMTQLERNGDVVEFASYAPLVGRLGHTQWNPDLIYFDGKSVYPTVNYYTQLLFGQNHGDTYYHNVITLDGKEFDRSSCVRNSATGDVYLKMVNMEDKEQTLDINLSGMKSLGRKATLTILHSDNVKAKNTKENPTNVLPQTKPTKVKSKMKYVMPAHSFSLIKISKK